MELTVNFDAQVIALFKEVRNLIWLNFQVPHAVSNISKEAKRVYPYAISLMESVRTLLQRSRGRGGRTRFCCRLRMRCLHGRVNGWRSVWIGRRHCWSGWWASRPMRRRLRRLCLRTPRHWEPGDGRVHRSLSLGVICGRDSLEFNGYTRRVVRSGLGDGEDGEEREWGRGDECWLEAEGGPLRA